MASWWRGEAPWRQLRRRGVSGAGAKAKAWLGGGSTTTAARRGLVGHRWLGGDLRRSFTAVRRCDKAKEEQVRSARAQAGLHHDDGFAASKGQRQGSQHSVERERRERDADTTSRSHRVVAAQHGSTGRQGEAGAGKGLLAHGIWATQACGEGKRRRGGVYMRTGGGEAHACGRGQGGERRMNACGRVVRGARARTSCRDVATRRR